VADDWVTYFVDWRYDPVLSYTPWNQGAPTGGSGYRDWHAVRTGLVNPLVAGPTNPNYFAFDGVSAPLPTIRPGGLSVPGLPFYPNEGQAQQWVDWNLAFSGFTVAPPDYYVLRTHSNPFPIAMPADNWAWVGLGANMQAVFSLGTHQLQSTPGHQIDFPNEPAIIAAHVYQSDSSVPPPRVGQPAAYGGPSPTFHIAFFHYQANPAVGVEPGTPPGPGWEMTCVNDPLAGVGGIGNWIFQFTSNHVICTETLAFRAPAPYP
jgi:hypothetical protein